MYIKFTDFTGKIAKVDIVLMSALEYANGGNQIKNVPVTITPDGKEPIEPSQLEPVPVPVPVLPEPTETELLRVEITDLKARLDKVEAVPLVKTALEPVAIIK